MANPAAASPEGDEPPPDAPLVLVIDNDPAARDLIRHYLHQNGFQVRCAGDGEEAVRLARSLRPDAITLDILLPDRDGLLILAELKADAATRTIPVVVVSVTDRRELGMSLGAADWLVKPVHSHALISALERTIGRAVVGGSHTVLVVDDEAATRDYVGELLRQQGCNVLTAADGQAGISLALARRPDLVILDLVMPDLNGFDVVRALRADPEGQRIPVVILTAKDLSAAEARWLSGSVQAIVAKGGTGDLLAELARICPGMTPAALGPEAAP